MGNHTCVTTRTAPGALARDEILRFASLYPSKPGVLAHVLAPHPLLTLEALARACERMNPANVLCHAAKNRNGEGFAPAARPERSIADTVRGIAHAGRYVMMSFVEQLPEYAELMRATVAELEPAIRPRTGEPLQLRAFLFISSLRTLAPFHFDAEYNVLFQIAGTKDFAVYPPVAPWITDESNERYHRTGDNLLPWRESFAGEGQHVPLAPGDALFVPYRWPHWVTVGDEPSISLSFTWNSRAGFEQNDAYRLNAWLRRFGLSPGSPAPLPTRSAVRSVAWRALSRLRLA
ncbi:MAG TPA: cupin-like domain-containing protein [Croceibacterium sp.]